MPTRKSLGQNFLIDRGAVRRIIDALELCGDETLLEIGPGRGALTADLVRVAGRIAAVELDSDLAAQLTRSFATEHLVLFRENVLRLDPREVLAALDAPAAGRLVIVGNLPYNISKPIAQMLIRERERIDRAVLTFQREVARRLTAGPGSRDYGPLSILVGLNFHVERLFDLGPRAFAPRPRVVSSVTRWRRRIDDGLGRGTEQRLRPVLSACFARRRKTLRNNLRAVLGEQSAVERLLADAGIDGDLRAEAVSPASFLKLAAVWEPRSLL